MRHECEGRPFHQASDLVSMEEEEKLTSRPGSGEPVYQDCVRALDEFDAFEDDEDESSTAAFLAIGERASCIALYGEDPLGQEGIYQLPVVKQMVFYFSTVRILLTLSLYTNPTVRILLRRCSTNDISQAFIPFGILVGVAGKCKWCCRTLRQDARDWRMARNGYIPNTCPSMHR